MIVKIKLYGNTKFRMQVCFFLGSLTIVSQRTTWKVGILLGFSPRSFLAQLRTKKTRATEDALRPRVKSGVGRDCGAQGRWVSGGQA